MKKFGSWTEQATSKFRSNGQEITLAPPSSPSSSFTITLPNISAGDTLIGRTTTDQSANRIKNKHLDSSSNFFVDSTDTTKRAWIDSQLLSTAQTVALIIPNQAQMVANGLTLVGTNSTQTLTNKSIDADSNSITNIDNADIKALAGIDASKIADGSVSNTEFQFLQNLLSAAVGVSDTQTLTNKTLTTPQVNEAVALTATSTELNQLDGVSVGGTAIGDIITTDDVQTLSNKSLITPKIYDTAIDSTYNIVAAGDLAGSRQIFLPILGADDTFVFQAHTQGLQNKTITASTIDSDLNVITNIVNADIKATAGIQFSKMAGLTPNSATEVNGSGVIVASAITTTELNRLSGVTSNIQTQIDGKTNDVITTRGDLIRGNVSGQEERLPLGAIGQVLSSDGSDAIWTTLAGTGDVTSGASLTDNYIVRGDGGAKGVQTSLVYIDDSGNLGVGTAAPNTQVEIVSSDRVVGPTLRLGQAINVSDWALGDTIGTLEFYGYDVSNASLKGEITVEADTGTNVLGVDKSRMQLKTLVSNVLTPVMTLNSLGNVGIGETNPFGKLDVVGTGTSSVPTLKITSTGTGAYVWGQQTLAPNLTAGQKVINQFGQAGSNNNAGYIGFTYNAAGSTSNAITFGLFNNNDLMVIQGTGNVGVGTPSPDTRLHVFGANDTTFGDLIVEGSGHNGMISLYGAGANASSRNWMIATNYQNYGDLNFRRSTISTGNPATLTMSLSNAGHLIMNGGNITGLESDLGSTAYTLSAGATSGALQLMQNGTAVVQFAGAGGANYHYLNSGSNFGVGTNTPAALVDISKGMSNASTGVWSTPHLRLTAEDNVDTNGFVGITMATSSTNLYGISVGARRTGVTANPTFSVRQHFNSAIGAEIFSVSDAGNALITGAGNSSLTIQAGSGTTDAFLQLTDTAGIALDGLKIWYDGSTGSSYIDNMYNNTAGDIYFRTTAAGTPKNVLTLSGDGYAGIGTAAPSKALHVEGDTSADVVLYSYNTNASGYGAMIGTLSTTSTRYIADFRSGGTGTGNSKFVVKADGLVGINTYSPLATLHISSATPAIRLQDTDTTSYTDLNANSTAGSFFIQVDQGNNTASSIFAVDIDGTRRLVMESSGELGLAGQTAPDCALQIGTETATSTATPVQLSLGGTYKNALGAEPKLKVYDSGTAYMGISAALNQMEYSTSGTAIDHVWYSAGTELMRMDSAQQMLQFDRSTTALSTTPTNIFVYNAAENGNGLYQIDVAASDGLAAYFAKYMLHVGSPTTFYEVYDPSAIYAASFSGGNFRLTTTISVTARISVIKLA